MNYLIMNEINQEPGEQRRKYYKALNYSVFLK